MCVTLVLTFSRGGWLAVCIAVFLLPFIKKPKYLVHFSIALLVLGFLLYVTGAIEYGFELVKSLNPRALAFRSKLFELGIEAVRRHPLTGVGVNNFAEFSGNHFRAPVHNGPLQVFSEMGLVGGLPWLGIILLVVVRSAATYVRNFRLPSNLFIGCALLGLITLTAHMQTEPIANSPVTWVYFGFAESMNLIYGR
jgi:O-antigen ligase